MKYDVIVVGGGIMGCASSYYLARSGLRVLLVDQFSIESAPNASHDYSRAFRYEYGTDEFYSKLAMESLRLWKEIESVSHSQLYYRCGALLLGNEDDDYAMGSYKTLQQLGCEVAAYYGDELSSRYPQFRATYGVLDCNAGILDARRSVSVFLALARRHGVEVRERAHVVSVEHNRVILETGEEFESRWTVIAAGPWINELLHKHIVTPTKQQLVYFRPKEARIFSKTTCPLFAYLDEGYYGFPIYGINAVKLANHFPGPETDIDFSGTADEVFVQEARRFLYRFIPLLAEAELAYSKTCMYDSSSDNDFILDEIWPNAILLSGFSGHGFKFAPLVGSYVAKIVIDDSFEIPERFRLHVL